MTALRATLALAAAAWLAAALPAQEAIPESIVDRDRPIRGPVRAIAGATWERPTRALDPEPAHGLFVADDGGRIHHLPATGPLRAPLEVAELGPGWELGAPLGMAFDDPALYVYEGESRRLWRVEDARRGEPRRPLELGIELERPTHLAVSPEGLLAVIDGGRLLFLAEGLEPQVYGRSEFPGAAGLAFSSWDTLQVLDGSRDALVTIVLARYKDGSIAFRSESEEVAARRDGERLVAMTVRDGVVYLATDERVFALAGERLVPVLPQSLRFDRILDLAVTADALWVLDDGFLVGVPRLEPVDFVLEGLPDESQAALVELYAQLARRDLLPTRRVRTRRDYDRIETFLFEQGVLLTPRTEPAPELRVYAQRKVDRLYAEQKRALEPRPDPDAPAGRELLCRLNPGLCERGAPGGLRQDQEIVVPDLPIERRLSRKRILLERPLGDEVARLIPSEALRRHVDAAAIRRLNPDRAELSDAELWAADRGAVTLPVESWSLTVAVPPEAYDDAASELWSFAWRFPGASWRSRSAFVQRAGDSARAQPPDDGGEEGDDEALCAALRARWREWLAAIDRPLPQPDPAPDDAGLASPRVRLGVLEFASTLLTSHQVFTLLPDEPTWHDFNVLGELEPIPVAASAAGGPQVVADAATYSPGAHHATHVSALIAGRGGACWSGLLPEARLVLVDLAANADVARKVNTAINEEVRVFNVSSTFAGPRDDLRRTIFEDDRALWVVAAGNDGENLDSTDEAAVPAPARWGWASNVVAVTAADRNGEILAALDTPEGPTPGVNFGKRYVDLVAPGLDIVSASEQNRYGPATGTSQAAPQVAAAAALLVDRLGAQLTPDDAKARLIATASWKSSYAGKVWGGRLDFGAATAHPDRNMIQTATAAARGERHALVADNDPKVEIRNLARLYERSGGTGDTAPASIPFSRILSLRRNADGSYRVVFREHGTDQLRIVLDAELSDTGNRIRCASYEKLDPATGTFAPSPGCDAGLAVTQIQTYFQGGHYRVQWEDQP
ncbi:MAG TPA: S8 family serine peptidase [Thermoanaerobaculia bacterium]|nr:S8 family serine peptidase [Thermoanaerobaculia bacterium]